MYFDCEKTFQSRGGNKIKMNFIMFFIKNNSTLSSLLTLLLEPFGLAAFPSPDFSNLLNIDLLVQWYLFFSIRFNCCAFNIFVFSFLKQVLRRT